jgi:tetratricopeptide (TPR) repeat protein
MKKPCAMVRRLGSLVALAALLSMTAAAVDVALIKGVCKDESGNPIAGARMEIFNAASNEENVVITKTDGSFVSPNLAAGSYRLTLTGTDGKLLFQIDDVPAKAGSETNVDFDLGKLKAEQAKRDAANEALRKQKEAIEQENAKIRNLNSLLKQAAEQKKAEQYADAVATMERAAALDDSHDIVYGALADAYSLDKKFPQAEAAYRKALALAPAGSGNLAGYRAGLALALQQQNKLEASAAECETLAALDRSLSSQCYFNQGAVLTNQGNADAAVAAFDKAIAADPTRADVYYHKGVNLLARATLGKDNKMVPAPGTAEAFRKYLDLAPDGKYAQSAKELLGSLGASIHASYGERSEGEKVKVP